VERCLACDADKRPATLAKTERWLREFELETEPAQLGEIDREFHAALYAPAKKGKLSS
jgi:DNA-binding GntR family transcriptional regulator